MTDDERVQRLAGAAVGCGVDPAAATELAVNVCQALLLLDDVDPLPICRSAIDHRVQHFGLTTTYGPPFGSALLATELAGAWLACNAR